MATEEELQNNLDIRRHYNLLRNRGIPHEHALRLAHGNLGPVVCGTDTQLFLSKSNDGFVGNDLGRKIALAKARQAGVSTAGKMFVPGLCPKGEMYSPKAWCGDKAEVVKKAEALGRNVEGSIQHFTPVRDKDYAKVEAPYRVAPKLVAEDVQEANQQRFGGKATKAQVQTLLEEKIDLHSGNQK